MYTKLLPTTTAGFGGASALVLPDSAFGILASFVASTTLLMAAVSVTKLLPSVRRHR
ncbi:hypothetical protein [Streptomyces blastmyceticus]|uniref:Uncharacterized protein n=1 Tax=Streptomyces blastmyceticus TaxID=68180 RepID=A0ABN0WBP8_9ACTN